MLLGARVEAAEADNLIVFYDPDANYEAVPRIGSGITRHLAQKLPKYRLRVTADLASTLSVIKENRAGYAIMGSEYLQTDRSIRALPLLVPEARGSVYYNKILVDRQDGPPGDLRHKRIAAVAGDPHGHGAAEKVFSTLKAAGLQIDGALFLGTTKDIDALLALVFSQADAALVTVASVNRLKQINPVAAATLRSLWRSPDILRAPLVALQTYEIGKDRAEVTAAIQDLMSTTPGQSAMQALGIERWVTYSPDLPHPGGAP